MKSSLICAFALTVAASAFAVGDDLITGFTASQDQSTRLVSADFTLTSPAILFVDVVTNVAPDSTETASIGRENFSTLHDFSWNPSEFPANRVMPARTYKFLWQPRKDWPGWKLRDTVSIVVRAYRLDSPPDYMVVEMDGSKTKRFYENADELPGGGVTNDVYKTDKLVMRRIPASGVTWLMGNPSVTTGPAATTAHYVTLTNDYYLSVYEHTKGMAVKIGEYGSTSQDRRNGDTGRAWTTVRGGNWPAGGHSGLSNSSDAQKMRNKTGLQIDLPTEAQWEFAIRAGTGTEYYWGSESSSEYEIGKPGSSGIGVVGRKKPNGFGLYDMGSNNSEWVLDRYAEFTADAVVDPLGPSDEGITSHVCRGANGSKDVTTMQSFYRCGQGLSKDVPYTYVARWCCPAVIPAE